MNFLYQLLDSNYLLANPSVVAALAAGIVTTTVALLTFIGVLLSNRSSTERAHADREHSSLQNTSEREAMQHRITLEHRHRTEEAHKERLTTTRRQVYLEAVDAWAGAQIAIMKLAGSDLSNFEGNTYFERLSASFSKIRVVADQETAMVAQELFAQFSQTLITGMSILMPQGSLRGALIVHEHEYSKAQTSIEVLLAEMKAFNKRGGTDEAEFARMQRAYEIEARTAEAHGDEAEKIRSELLRLGNIYRQHQIDWSISISHKMVDFTCSLRSELGIATDAQALHAQTEEVNREARKALDAFLVHIQNESKN